MADTAIDVCSVCQGSGLQMTVDADGSRVAAECVCRAAQRALRRLKQANIPKQYEYSTLGSYESIFEGSHKSLLLAHFKANKFVVGFPYSTNAPGLMFVGRSGLGKTHLAIGVLRALVEERGCQGVFCSYGDLLRQIQSSYNARSETTEFELLKPVLKAEVLVLDDLGSTKPTAWVLDTVAYIVNARYNEKLTTIVTTNYENKAPALSQTHAISREDTLGDRIGERMRSRLVEMCVCIEMQGDDFRQSEAGRAKFQDSDANEW